MHRSRMKVFISHSNSEEKLARKIATLLVDSGVEVKIRGVLVLLLELPESLSRLVEFLQLALNFTKQEGQLGEIGELARPLLRHLEGFLVPATLYEERSGNAHDPRREVPG